MKLTEKQKILYDLIRKNPTASMRELGEIMGTCRQNIFLKVVSLEKKGLLHRRGHKRVLITNVTIDD